MTELHDPIWTGGPTPSDIMEEVRGKWVTQRLHPRLPLQIFNYSHKTPPKQHWNAVTTVTRGLILDDQWNVVARPFSKFWNLGESNCPAIPDEPFEVYEKMDGCLGIMYWEDGFPSIATRGSFMSWQALAATKFIQSIPDGKWDPWMCSSFSTSHTYLFEYIHPNNRIVVDYGNKEQLTLLAIIDTETGTDIPLEIADGSPLDVVERYDGISDYNKLSVHDRHNHEGYVIRFQSGLRVKVKHDEYCYLHRLVTQMTPRVIWELMRAGAPVDEIIEDAPPQFREWVAERCVEIHRQYQNMEATCMSDFLRAPTTRDRKTLALFFQTCMFPDVLFKMLDQKPYEDIIWKAIKPEAAEPFRVEV